MIAVKISHLKNGYNVNDIFKYCLHNGSFKWNNSYHRNSPLFLSTTSIQIKICICRRCCRIYIGFCCVYQDLGAQWEDYNTLVYAVDTLLNEAEESIPVIDVENATGQELISQLNDAKVNISSLLIMIMASSLLLL